VAASIVLVGSRRLMEDRATSVEVSFLPPDRVCRYASNVQLARRRRAVGDPVCRALKTDTTWTRCSGVSLAQTERFSTQTAESVLDVQQATGREKLR
jgi:hypothetical protein